MILNDLGHGKRDGEETHYYNNLSLSILKQSLQSVPQAACLPLFHKDPLSIIILLT